jgi:hypothetical protein
VSFLQFVSYSEILDGYGLNLVLVSTTYIRLIILRRLFMLLEKNCSPAQKVMPDFLTLMFGSSILW